MVFKFGKYVNWIGPYQIADWLQNFGVSEDRCYKIGKKLSETWLDGFCQWIHDKRKHKIVVKVEPHDIWSMDYTLAQIIHPMLILLKEKKHGTPFVYNCDIPEQFHKNFEDNDHFGFDGKNGDWNEEGWGWIMDEMIWAFERIKLDDIDNMSYTNGTYSVDKNMELSNRIDNGTALFGKYFRTLWD